VWYMAFPDYIVNTDFDNGVTTRLSVTRNGLTRRCPHVCRNDSDDANRLFVLLC